MVCLRCCLRLGSVCLWKALSGVVGTLRWKLSESGSYTRYSQEHFVVSVLTVLTRMLWRANWPAACTLVYLLRV